VYRAIRRGRRALRFFFKPSSAVAVVFCLEGTWHVRGTHAQEPQPGGGPRADPQQAFLILRPSPCYPRREIWLKGDAASLKLADVVGGLDLAPCAKGVVADAQQVGFSTARKTKASHG
jgi:hypothetical protein